MITIGFIRHGITDWNREQRIQGHSDIPLNEEGRLQARKLAERIAGERWDFIVSSNLSRAAETADTISRRSNIRIAAYDPRLREMYCGQIEGTTQKERVDKWGEHWRELELGMENPDDIAARGLQLVEELAGKHAGSRFLLVSHGGLIAHTLRKLVPHLDTAMHLGNTSITVVTRDENRWECELYNCTLHLD